MKNNSSIIKSFFAIYWPILMGFLLFRIIIQTDLIMLAPYGTKYLAAYGIPAKIMLLDTVFAFTLGPVASIYVAQAKNYSEKLFAVQNILVLSGIICVLITAIGFGVYPLVLQVTITQDAILKPAKLALYWQNLSVPFRVLIFVSTLILHALNLGKAVLKIDFLILLLNPVFNYLLIKFFGPEGIFIATFILNIFSCTLFFLILKKSFKNIFTDFKISKKFLKDFCLKSRSEFFRLIFYFGQGFLIIFLLAQSSFEPTSLLGAFLPAFEFTQVILMFFMAFMRCTGIFAAQILNKDLWQKFITLKPITNIFLVATLTFSALLLVFKDAIGSQLYSISGLELSIFSTYLLFFASSLPFVVINSFMRGLLQSYKEFSFIFKVELISRWLISMPILLFMLSAKNLFYIWSYLLLSGVFEFIVLTAKIFPRQSLRNCLKNI